MPPTTIERYIDQDSRILDPSRRELEPADGDMAYASAAIKAVDTDSRTVTGLVSTSNIDRFEEIIEPSAFEPWLETFMSNPVFLAGHQHVGFDAAEPTVIGHWQELRRTDEGVVGTAKFAETPLAERYWTLYRDGHLKAFSVGGLVHEWEMREFELEPGVNKKLRVITNMELIEISAVAVPANRQALVRAASALAARIGGQANEKDGGDGDISIERLADLLVERITPKVAESIIKQLSHEPGSRLHLLLADTAEQAVREVMRQPGHQETKDGDGGGDEPKDPLRSFFG